MGKKIEDLREMDEYWDLAKLRSLKRLGEQISEKLYPDVISPLIETDDIAEGYLGLAMPYSSSISKPYISWCMHKYPPYKLGLSKRLHYKKFLAFDPFIEEELDINVSLKGSFSKNLLEAVIRRFRPTYDLLGQGESPIVRINAFNEQLMLLDDIRVRETKEFDSLYLAEIDDFKRAREKTLFDNLENFSKNEVVKHLSNDHKFDQIFEEFYKDFEIFESEYHETAKEVVKYRFLLHVIILVLRVSGFHLSLDLSLDNIKKYKKVLEEDVEAEFYNIRVLLQDMEVHHTLPTKKELDTIRGSAEKLLKKLNGRSENYELLLWLEQLTHAKTDDFSIRGRLTQKLNMPIRAFIKSLASFIWLYQYDLLLGYSAVLSSEELEQVYQNFEAKLNSLVEKISGIFFHDVTETYVGNNTKEILDEAREVLGLKDKPKTPLQESLGRVHLDILRRERRGANISPSFIEYIKSSIGQVESKEERIKQVDSALFLSSGSGYWIDPFGYTGQVDDKNGLIDLFRMDLPKVQESDMSLYLEGARDILRTNINQLI